MTPSDEGLRAVAEAGRQLASTRSLDVALKLVVGSAARLTGAAHAAIVLRRPDGSVTRFRSTGWPASPQPGRAAPRPSHRI